MNSKFIQRPGVQRTPRICKAVGDSFRFVTVPFKQQMSAYVDQTWGGESLSFNFNGYGVLQQQGNPLQIWKVRIGPLLAEHVDLTLTYDTIVNVLSILYIATAFIVPVLTRTRTIANIDLKKPFGTRLIELPPDPLNGRIFIQLLY